MQYPPLHIDVAEELSARCRLPTRGPTGAKRWKPITG